MASGYALSLTVSGIAFAIAAAVAAVVLRAGRPPPSGHGGREPEFQNAASEK
jgi:hypothetical protein